MKAEMAAELADVAIGVAREPDGYERLYGKRRLKEIKVYERIRDHHPDLLAELMREHPQQSLIDAVRSSIPWEIRFPDGDYPAPS